jgi:uncharacterized protein
MSKAPLPEIVAFEGDRLVAAGRRAEVSAALERRKAGAGAQVLAFDGRTGRLVDLDPRAAIHSKPAAHEAERRGPGRPKLGVMAREVTLLPRHWDWLNAQPGGASVALRKLVDEARRTSAESDAVRAAQECAYQFMTAMAGNLPGYEDACRALFSGDAEGFDAASRGWPRDIRRHAQAMAAGAFAG